MSAPNMPMMNEKGLLECAHCSSLDVTVRIRDECALKEYNVECTDCGMRTEWLLGGATHVIRKWNTRNGNLYTAEDFNHATQERE